MKVEEEEEEEARSDCSSEFAFDALRNQHKRQKRIHHHQRICLSFQKARAHSVDDRKERRKRSPTEDVVLISAWLNTSKDPVVGNEHKAIAFWKRIAAYFGSSPKLVGLQKREPSHGDTKIRVHVTQESKRGGCQHQFEKLFIHNDDRHEASRSKKKRAYIEGQREQRHLQLWNDYFSEDETYPSHMFRCRFRMNKSLFMRIVDRLSAEISCIQQRRDATGRFGHFPLQKATAAIRMMAYGCPADAVDEYLRLGETTALLCLEHFAQGIINLFGDEYLRRPTPEDLQRLLDIGEIRGFSGMIGSIVCTLNDINILDRSPVFDDISQGRALKVNYIVNGHEYHLAYYLTDGIYPKWATFVQSIPLPQGSKVSLFAIHQEVVRKDVKRAFGVLQARFAVVKNPYLLWDKIKIGKIMRACIILHNMILEDEREGYT
uniref:DDE Tnp4 domain-containing protein n=1 Tax=Brassica oleracea var. oleracea TaxID=109376 RepID=A0A0D3AV34_BRAOL